MMWKYFFTRGQSKKIKNEKKRPNQCHVSEFAELDGGIMEKKLGGCKSKRNFYKIKTKFLQG